MAKFNPQQKVLAANDAAAEFNRKVLSENGITTVNLISSPGAGKTTLLVETIKHLRGRIDCGVIEGDVQTDIDTQRIAALGVPAVQINTRGGCHLNAVQVHQAMRQLPLQDVKLLFIENVGNLICPTGFDLGEDAKIALLSVPEGDDKVLKYPAIFARAAAVVITKTDLLQVSEFSLEKTRAQLAKLNPIAPVFALSARTGRQIQQWCRWLEQLCAKKTTSRTNG